MLTPSLTVAYTFSWEANHPNDLVVIYRIYWRSDSGEYNQIDREEIMIENLSDTENPEWTLQTTISIPPDTLCFVCTAVDNYGYESDFSNEIGEGATCGTIDLYKGWEVYPMKSAKNNGTAGGGDAAGGGGCFIATAAYGSRMAWEINILKKFRDEVMLNYSIGRNLVDLYYNLSPPMADFITKHDSLRAMIRVSLLPFIGISWVALKIGLIPTMVCIFLFGYSLVHMLKTRKKYRT